MDTLHKGWFSEFSDFWTGQCFSLKVKEVLHHEKSKLQDILVFDSTDYGRVLVLDGAIQCTERDEFSYQEMIAHLPLFCHLKPEEVLIIGGGDGGVAREVLKHSCVNRVTMCEIDNRVIEVSKTYFPSISSSFSHPKLEVIIDDGFQFLKNHRYEYDVIITDSSDPIGPAVSLFQKPYYVLLKSALKPGGIICAQGECMWRHLDLIKDMQAFCKDLFPVVEYSYCSIPTYPCGQIGFLLCSVNPELSFSKPVREITDVEIERMKLRYYNTDVHRASFVLPQSIKKALKEGVIISHDITSDESQQRNHISKI